MSNNNYNDLYYNYLINLYTSQHDEKTVEEIKKLKQSCPDFPFEHYIKNVFTEEHIRYYGMEFLLKTSKFKESNIYDYGMQGDKEKEKLMYYLMSPSLNKLNGVVLYSNVIDINKLKKLEFLLKEVNITNFLNNILYQNKDINIILKVLKKEKEYENIKFLTNFFELSGKYDKVCNYLGDNKFNDFIKIIDTNYLNTDLSIDKFLKIYQKYKSLLINIDLNSISYIQKQKLNAILFSGDNLSLEVTMLEDIDNYYENRFKYIYDMVGKNDIYLIKSIIAEVYYNCSYRKLKMYINDAIKTFETVNYDYEDIKKYFLIANIDNNEDLRKLLLNIKNENNILSKINEVQKRITTKELSNKLNSFNLIKTPEIVNLKGENFLFLLHKIKGYGDYELASKLYDDPSLWFKHPETSEYISTTLVNNDNFGLVPGSGYVLGFNKVKDSDIIAMGPDDIYINGRIVKNNLNNSKNRYLLTGDLLDKSRRMYNEVAIKRMSNGIITVPDLVFAHSEPNNKEKEVSKFFNIPIYQIEPVIYAEKMLEKQEKYLKQEEFYKYINSYKRMYFSFMNNYDIINKYFNISYMQRKMESIVYNYMNSKNVNYKKLQELLYMLKGFKSLVDAINFLDDSYESINTEELKKIIVKKI